MNFKNYPLSLLDLFLVLGNFLVGSGQFDRIRIRPKRFGSDRFWIRNTASSHPPVLAPPIDTNGCEGVLARWGKSLIAIPLDYVTIGGGQVPISTHPLMPAVYFTIPGVVTAPCPLTNTPLPPPPPIPLIPIQDTSFRSVSLRLVCFLLFP